MRHLKAALIALVLPVFLVSCKEKTAASDGPEIVIGEYASMTGPTATFGQESHEGIELAREEINHASGILGKQIKVITEDDRSEQQEATTAVQKLISRDHVVAMLGEVASSRSLAGATVCQQYKVPMLSSASTNPGVTQVGDYIFRICFIDDFQGKVCAQFAGKRGWQRVAIFMDVANDYSKGLTSAFKATYPSTGGTIVAEESFRENDNDFQAQLAKIKSANPDAVFLPGYYTEACKILKQARQLGLNVPFFGGDGWDSPQTLEVGAVANNCFFTNHYSPEDPRPEVKEFIKAYRAKYGRVPGAMAILGYDSMKIMADAIKRAGSTDSKAIRDALAQTKNYPGASGKITIDENRNALKPIVILEILNGQTRLVDSIAPD